MTIMEWGTTPQAYLALATYITFAIALIASINGFFNILGTMLKWHASGCNRDLNFGGTSWVLWAWWIVFVALKFFLDKSMGL